MKKRLFRGIIVIMALSLFTGCSTLKSLTGGKGASASPSASIQPSSAAETAGTSPSPTAAIRPGTSGAVSPAVSAVQGGLALATDNTYTYKSSFIETDATLPTFSGIKDTAVMKKVNGIFGDYMSALKKSSADMEADSKSMAQSGSQNPYMLSVSYSIPYNKGDILCVLISSYVYLGGAHGGTELLSYTFNLTTGEVLTLSTLMQQGSSYRALMNKAILAEIDKRGLGDAMQITPFSDIGENAKFYLTADGIVIYFSEYEYFPYAAGIQEFTIPYGDLSAQLKKEYAGLKLQTVKLSADSKNTMAVGDVGQVILKGNSSTGYFWTYTIADKSVVGYCGQSSVSDGASGMTGAGETDTWSFRAQSPGTTTIIFTYMDYASSQSNTKPQETIQYTITVK